MGRVLGDRYELERIIGEGSFAVVWAAWDHTGAEWVAVKRAKELGEEPMLRAIREQRLGVEHPHLCGQLDRGFDGETPYVVMQLVTGGSLAVHLGDEGPMDPSVVQELVRQIHGALDHLHRSGIVHRDVQPANILLAATPPAGGPLHAYLSDLGSAVRQDGLRFTQPRSGIATPGYRAPALVDSHEPDERSDYYSLAVVAYEACTGVPIAHEDDPAPLPGCVRFRTASDLDWSSVPPALAGYIARQLDGGADQPPSAPDRPTPPPQVIVSEKLDLPPAPPPRRRSRVDARLIVGVAAAFAVVVALVIGLGRFGSEAEPTTEAPDQDVRFERSGFRPRGIGVIPAVDGTLRIALVNDVGALLVRSQVPTGDRWGSYRVVSTGWPARAGVAVGTAADGRAQIFVIARNGELFVTEQATRGGQEWAARRSLGGSWRQDNEIGLGRTADGRTLVFVVGFTGELYRAAQVAPNSGDWTGFRSLGGSWRPDRDIGVGRTRDGRAEVMLIGFSGRLYLNEETEPNGDGWSGFRAVEGGSSLEHGPVDALVDGASQTTAFARSSDGALLATRRAADGSVWSEWAEVRGGVDRASDVAVGTRPGGTPVVAIARRDGVLIGESAEDTGESWTFAKVAPAPAGLDGPLAMGSTPDRALVAWIDADGRLRGAEAVGGGSWRALAPSRVPAGSDSIPD